MIEVPNVNPLQHPTQRQVEANRYRGSAAHQESAAAENRVLEPKLARLLLEHAKTARRLAEYLSHE